MGTPAVVRLLQSREGGMACLLWRILRSTSCEFADAYQARWTVVRMWYEGWNKHRIAGCLQMARSHVYAIMAAFERDGFEGLEDQRTRPAPHPDDQLTLPFLKDVLDLQQEYPRAGRFRLPGLLEQQYGPDLPSESTVGRAMAINRRVHGAPGRGPVPETSRKLGQSHDTCRIARTIGTLSGLWIFGIS